MRPTRCVLPVVVLAAVSVLSCAADHGPSAPEAAPAAGPALPVEQLWTDFCHYVVIASPQLAAAYGERLAADATPEQLRALLAAEDATTRRALHLLDDTALPDRHPALGSAWRRIRARANEE